MGILSQEEAAAGTSGGGNSTAQLADVGTIAGGGPVTPYIPTLREGEVCLAVAVEDLLRAICQLSVLIYLGGVLG
jgi:hypothetical protein